MNRQRKLVIALVLLGSLSFSSPIFAQKAGKVEVKSQKTGKNYIFKVEIAETEKERSLGLMYREKMDRRAGMLFIYPDQAMRSFWMKNTRIPLDMIFMDEDQRIVHIHQHAVPMSEETISSQFPARYVLEINAGLAKKFKFLAGDKVKIRIPSP